MESEVEKALERAAFYRKLIQADKDALNRSEKALIILADEVLEMRLTLIDTLKRLHDELKTNV